MLDLIKLLRVKHYIKNFLIFLPLFFSGRVFDFQLLKVTFCGFICFCFISSAVYIFNDIIDVEKDKNHPSKKNRPIASGRISIKRAVLYGLICIFLVVVISFVTGLNAIMGSNVLLVLYFVVNIMYSLFLKKVPIIDVAALASCYIIRVFYGGVVGNIAISVWLYLVVLSASLYLGLGKRRNEIKINTDSRDVLQYYTPVFLDKNMYVCLTLANVFYSLWAMESSNPYMVISIPFFIIVMMFYSLDLEGSCEGDLVEIIFTDIKLALSMISFAVCICFLVYLG